MAVRASSRSSFVFFGARFPAAVVWLAGVVLAGSCLAAVDWRVGYKLLRFVTLDPELVLRGEVWRLFTWSFFELRPLNLIFGCLVLLIFGRDLSDVWGARRLWVTYVVITVLTGGLTTLLSLAWRDLRAWDDVTVWPLADALIVAWATLFPTRQMLVYFVIPLGGRNLIYVTIGGTLVFALLSGFALFVPHFIALGLMLAYLREPSIGRLWQRLTLGMRGGPKRRPTHLRAVDRLDREDEPPRWLH
jgi:membrane associated rhomboid family serine protease